MSGFAGNFGVIDSLSSALLGQELGLMETMKVEVDGAQLDHLAFGIVGGFFVSGPYNSAWEYQKTNVAQGVQKYLDMVDGLRVVAHTYQRAEDANTMYDKGQYKSVTEARQGASKDSGGTFNVPVSIGLGAGMGLGILYQAIMGVLSVGSKVSIAAGAATVAWAVTQPNDEALEHAIVKWRGAASQADTFAPALTAKINKYLSTDKGWTAGDALQAFNDFVTVFKTEVGQAGAAATQNATSLTSIAQTLSIMNSIFMGVAITLVITMLICAALEVLPYVGVEAKAVKEFLGGALTLLTGKAVAGIVEVLSVAAPLMTGQIAKSGFAFSAPVANAAGAGSGTDFKDIRIDWASPQ